MSPKQKKVIKLIKRFNFNFPSITTKKIFNNKEQNQIVSKKFYRKNVFSKVYTQKLLAKQQLKNIYGINEYRLKKCINLGFVFDKKNNEGIILNIYNILENHLYFLLFKEGVAKTINQAKQMISHKQILINSKVCPFTYYICHIGDIVSSKYYNFNPFIIKKKNIQLSYKYNFLISKMLEFFK